MFITMFWKHLYDCNCTDVKNLKLKSPFYDIHIIDKIFVSSVDIVASRVSFLLQIHSITHCERTVCKQ